jgi:hypothetical protein
VRSACKRRGLQHLPGLTPDFSDLCVIAKVVSMDFRTLIGEILAGCIKRYRGGRATASLPFAAPVGPLVSPPVPIAHSLAKSTGN